MFDCFLDRNPKLAKERQHFQEGKQPFTRLILAHERLRDAEASRKISLPKARRFATIPKKGSQCLLAFAVRVTNHKSFFRIS